MKYFLTSPFKLVFSQNTNHDELEIGDYNEQFLFETICSWNHLKKTLVRLRVVWRVPPGPPTKQASLFQWNFALNLKDANKYLASGLRLDSCPCIVYGYTNLRHVSFSLPA